MGMPDMSVKTMELSIIANQVKIKIVSIAHTITRLYWQKENFNNTY